MTRQFRQNLVTALIIGLGLFGILAILTTGVPLQYYPQFCFFNGCAYQPLYVGLDLLFWVGVGFVLVSTADRVSDKWGEEPFLRYNERAEIKFLITLVFFGSAMFPYGRVSGLELGLSAGTAGTSAPQSSQFPRSSFS